jgi:hypothetical protein
LRTADLAVANPSTTLKENSNEIKQSGTWRRGTVAPAEERTSRWRRGTFGKSTDRTACGFSGRDGTDGGAAERRSKEENGGGCGPAECEKNRRSESNFGRRQRPAARFTKSRKKGGGTTREKPNPNAISTANKSGRA